MSQNSQSPKALSTDLEAHKQHFLKVADQDKIDTYEEGIQDVIKSGIENSALQVGSDYVDFSLDNAKGEAVSLSNLLASGPVVLTWYRGGWCPYCNITLKALQQVLPEIKALGANLVTLTPELPDNSLSTQEKNELSFEVLTDPDNEIARQYGLVFKLSPDTAKHYKAAFDLEVYNGNTTDELPLAATYVIDTNHKIRYAFLDADYRNRAEPSELIRALRSL